MVHAWLWRDYAYQRRQAFDISAVGRLVARSHGTSRHYPWVGFRVMCARVVMHVGKQFTRMAGVRPHQPRSPARPSALVRTNAHGRQTRTPVRSYDARDCREEGSEIGFPSHTAMSRSAPTEVLLAVLGAHQTDTLWCSNMCLRGVCQRT